MKSFLSDRPRVAAPVLINSETTDPASLGAVLHGAKAHAPGAPAGAGATGASHVECVRQGDKISRLIIICACGERIEIDCLYAGT